jgi:hypothetical protein
VAVGLVGVFFLSFLTAGEGIWLRRTTLDRDVFADRVVPLGEDPAVQAALAAWTTDQVMVAIDAREVLREALPERAEILALPLSVVLRDFVQERVDRFFASDRFEALWATAVVRAHGAAVATLRDELPNVDARDHVVTIDLLPVITAVLADVGVQAPDLFDREIEPAPAEADEPLARARARLADALDVELPESFGTVVVYDGGKLQSAQALVRTIDRALLGLILLTFGSFGGALVASVRRRRTLLQLLGAAAVACVLVRRATFVLEAQIEGIVQDPVNRPAVAAVLDALVEPMTTAAAVILVVLALAASVVLVTGPYPWAAQLRSRVTSSRWLVAYRDGLQVVGVVVAMVVLWVMPFSWIGLLGLAAALVGWLALLARVRDQAAVGVSAEQTGSGTHPVGEP